MIRKMGINMADKSILMVIMMNSNRFLLEELHSQLHPKPDRYNYMLVDDYGNGLNPYGH